MSGHHSAESIRSVNHRLARFCAWIRSPYRRSWISTASTNLPFEDTTDFDDADRGFIGALEPCIVKAADGRVVWDNDVYSFLAGDAPATVHPSLWRQSQLCAKQGLYEVVEGIYQVRGLDLSNISFIEGDTGVIVIDPLISHRDRGRCARVYTARTAAIGRSSQSSTPTATSITSAGCSA